eukprot:TRINITY_DN4722_c0_g1_i2.p2 TRINITY_DN4722_c0_g1~~TRINITY_DN4722_c0_g1_i2.p2  ORF type:complete len:178 (+),score=57.78 TRINITY_DN4722_c0_g1_i2:108-641(+)
MDAVSDPWSSYQREARALADDAEQKIMTLQRMSEAGGGSKDEAIAIEADVKNVLAMLDRANQGVPEAELTHAERLQVQRYRDVHDDNQYEVRRLVKTLTSQQERKELLGNVQNSIQIYSDSRRLLDQEQDSIDQATAAIQALHAQALEGQTSLQRTQLVLVRDDAFPLSLYTLKISL